MQDTQLSACLDATWGDPSTWVSNGLQWTHLESIREVINRRVTGDAKNPILQWFGHHLVNEKIKLPLRRVLVLGCGTGWVERDLHHLGLAREIVGLDLSPKVLDIARLAATGIDSIRYVLGNMNDLPVGQPCFEAGSFDAVFGVGSVHHCAELDRLYAAINRLLAPEGWFFLDEYVGPDRFQYSTIHLAQVTAVAELLPDWLLTTASGTIKRGFRAPTVKEVIEVDLSEAIYSSQILPLLPTYFDVMCLRPYGGSVLQLLLADVAQNFQAQEAQPWMQALIDAELELERQGTLEHHFSCAIARRRPPTGDVPNKNH
jgi:SAM-dependent methyltransferase